MKINNKLWLGAVALALLVACADESLLDYKVNKPEGIAQSEYLNDYDVLKSYVDRNASPNLNWEPVLRLVISINKGWYTVIWFQILMS